MTELENLYLNAKRTYYEGNPIMIDSKFDELEEKLKKMNSKVIEIVGSEELEKDIKHLSAMLSLQKIQVNDLSDKTIPVNKFKAWIKKTEEKFTELIAEPKFDGSSCNLIYDNGKLISAATRGNGLEGTNIIDKISLIVPKEIQTDYPGLIEIRGEVIIKTKTFEEKYSKIYKNPRNFVAGILGRDDISNCIQDFEFIAFEHKFYYDDMMEFGNDSFDFLQNLGFTVPSFYVKFNYQEFEKTFDSFLDFRINKSEYGLDGFVIKYPSELRKSINETSHHPKWAMAIKFPPMESITYIKKIQWNLGQSGEFKPIGVLEPIDLDGTTVSNVALHNLGSIQKLGLFPGAKVTIVKSGDIIPIVKNVIEPNFESDITKHLPSHCSNDCKIEIEGIHLVCNNPNCQEQLISKLGIGIGTFGLENIGGATIVKLYNSGIRKISDLFDRSKFNKETLIKSGLFKQGRSLDIIFESFEKRKPITMIRIINALAFKNVGWSTSKEISKIFENEKPDFSGKSYAAYSPFLNEKSTEYQIVLSFIKILNDNNFKIESEKEIIIDKNTITYELTGSPKEFGFKTKEEFVNKLKDRGYSHTDLNKDTHYLITDSLESSSSKMAKAKKLNVTIITYTQILEMIK
jgi:DNA ligase (NAD+)